MTRVIKDKITRISQINDWKIWLAVNLNFARFRKNKKVCFVPASVTRKVWEGSKFIL